MKSIVSTAVLLAVSASAAAGAQCDKVKSDIAAKLDARHVAHYMLETVPADKVGDGKVVGTCDRGRKKIVYTRK